jgi:hypothetical protein
MSDINKQGGGEHGPDLNRRYLLSLDLLRASVSAQEIVLNRAGNMPQAEVDRLGGLREQIIEARRAGENPRSWRLESTIPKADHIITTHSKEEAAFLIESVYVSLNQHVLPEEATEFAREQTNHAQSHIQHLQGISTVTDVRHSLTFYRDAETHQLGFTSSFAWEGSVTLGQYTENAMQPEQPSVKDQMIASLLDPEPDSPEATAE